MEAPARAILFAWCNFFVTFLGKALESQCFLCYDIDGDLYRLTKAAIPAKGEASCAQRRNTRCFAP